MAAADDGEILLSQAVVDAIDEVAMKSVDRGVRTLKGVPGEWRLWSLQSIDHGALPASVRSSESVSRPQSPGQI
jgi:class 3 adenylate cyclase